MKREDVSKIIPGITSDQLDSIMNLHGADITAKVNEITTLKAEKTTLTEQLSTANSKLEGYDPEWKAKAEQAKADAAAQIAALEKGYALERKASGLKFSSESARKAFLTDAKSQNFAMKDGEILGFDDYVKAGAQLHDGGAFGHVLLDGVHQLLPDQGLSLIASDCINSHKNQPFWPNAARNAAFAASCVFAGWPGAPVADAEKRAMPPSGRIALGSLSLKALT